MHGEQIINELKEEIDNGKGCIVFDLACFYSYFDAECLIFDFEIEQNGETKKIDDYKLNHRYPNKNYFTISKKTGKRVSKIGYPYFVDINKPLNFTLKIIIGNRALEDPEMYQTMTFWFPVSVTLTKETPACTISFHIIYKEKFIDIRTYKKSEDNGWLSTIWTNHIDDRLRKQGIIELDQPIEEPFNFKYKTIIQPAAQKIEDLLIL